MALPGDVTTFQLTFGHATNGYTDATGAVAMVGVKAKLFPVDLATGKRLNVLHVASGQEIVPKDITVTIDDSGKASVGPLPHTDNPGLSPIGFGYRVEWQVQSGSRRVAPDDKTFAVPTAAGATVDFDLLDVAEAVPGVYIPIGGLVDATATSKGRIQLAGDLAGTADAPTVPGLATKVDTSTYTAGLAAKANTADLAAVAQTGSYNDLANRPTLGTAAAQNSTAFDAAGAAAAAQAAAIQRANHTGTQSADTLTDGTTNKAFLATERTKLAGIATGATANATDAQLRDRSTHTGTQSADSIVDGSTNHAFTAADDTKLTGIATGATANDTDANLKARANHTGTQAAATITGLAAVATSGAYADVTGKPTIGPLNAADYGALGNDSADDTAALDAAVAAAKAQNRPLYIPAGTYRRTTALDLRGVMRVEGHSMNTTIIKQMTANTPVILLGHARQVAANLQATYGTVPTSTDTAANGFEFYHAQKCRYDNLFAFQVARGFFEPVVTYSSPGVTNTLNFFFSNVATNWQVTGFAIDGVKFEGGTGNVWNNIYLSNNPLGTRLAPTGRALSIRVMDEAVINQLNVEWMLASNVGPIFFESGGNMVINGLHIEQVDLSAFGAPLIQTSDRIRLIVSGVTIVYSSFTNAGNHALVTYFQQGHVDVRGLFQHDNTVAGTFALVNVSGATAGATFVGNGIDTSLFTTIAASELAAPNQVVRQVNDNRYRWQQNGKTHTTGTAAPTTGTWAVGDTVWNTAPAAAGTPGWVCTTAGTLPGTGAFKAMASLAA